MANLKLGMSDSEVKKLQEKLIAEGYDVGSTKADGVFGKNTLAAVKKYQKDNGLAEDGIAGKNTLGKLYATGSNKGNTGGTKKTNTGTPKATGAEKGNAGKAKDNPIAPAAPAAPKDAPAGADTPVTSPAGFTYGDFSYDPYAKSDIVLEAESLLQQWTANKPGSYTPVWQDEADAYLSQYQNRGPFSYDFNSDALYQQYKDQYIQQGQMAMMDTMGQAAAMTGGYGNSYAQTVGQQAYNQHLGQLNEVMPELYQMAYDRYGKEGQEMLDMYNLYMNREAMEYGKHQDTVDNWYREMSRLTDNANTLYARDYDEYLLGYNTALDEYTTDRSEEFSKWQTTQSQEFTANENEKDRLHQSEENQKSRAESQKANAKSDLVNLITSTGYNPTESELKAAGMSREQANSYAKAYSDSQKPKEPEYAKLEVGSTAYNVITKAIKGAASLDELNIITQEYIGQYGADAIKNLAVFKKKLEELTPKPLPPKKPSTGGGPSGGTMYYEVR